MLVKGPSTVNWISWMGGPRQDMAFPRVIEEQLLEAGRAAEVRAITMTSEKASWLLRTWQREVLGYSPDVIVLTYGHYESVHLFLPRWLERHGNSLKGRSGRGRRLYRRLVVRPVWRGLAHLQAKVDSVVGPHVGVRRARRVAADIEQYVHRVQQVGSPMVLVFEVLPPGPRVTGWFPGMARRIELVNREFAAMVERIGLDHVRLFPVMPLAEKYADGDMGLAEPDGFHYSPVLHRGIGEALAREIDAWAGTQSHLSDLGSDG
ncbi:hypothetical protein HMPREF0063_12775 [Aeromicrobium marinum DSM 15272]|uniref:SGNH hydrolase-type esterase domain-containing protein n=1 Tax=Aeromicrobium marinum DSM 15272 TaxID=585531 RepID=E2SFG6_9ACTN|nr:hypothetical protein HMPREF0063_12775 [Aeromicrobium marinum DSM 15272]